MKQLFCLFAALLLPLAASFAQAADYASDYYPRIHFAEMAILSDDFDGALRSYQAAFKAVDGGLARDYHNAALCAVKSGQPAFALVFFEKMALAGVTMEHFKRPFFAAVHQTPGWPAFEKAYPALHSRHLAETDLEYRRELSYMADLDQEFRQKEGSYAVYGDTIRHIDSLNLLRWQRLYAAKGYPSERLIGADFPGEPVYSIFLHHHAQHLSDGDKYAGWSDLGPQIVKAAQNGQVDPVEAAYWLELQNDPAYRYGAFGIINLRVAGSSKNRYYLDLPADRIAVDRQRALIGLEPLDQFEAKCKYKLQHPDTPFRLNSGNTINVFELGSEQEAEAFGKVLTKIELD